MPGKPILLASVTALTVFFGAWILDYSLRVETEADLRAQFETDASRAADLVAVRLQQVTHVLRDAGNIVVQSHLMAGRAAARFDRYVLNGRVLERHPELDALVFMRVFPNPGPGDAMSDVVAGLPSELDPLAEASREGSSRPRTGAFHVAVDLIHPVALKSPMAGFDVMASAHVDTLSRSLTHRDVAASGRVALFGGRPGLVLYKPIYATPDDMVPFGFMATGIAVEVVLETLRPLLTPLGVNLAVYDLGPDPAALDAVGDTTPLATFLTGAGTDLDHVVQDHRTHASAIRIADRMWQVVVRPANLSVGAPWRPGVTVLLAGLAAGLIGALVYAMQRGADALSALVDMRTRELRAAVAELDARRTEAERQAVQDDLTGLMNRRGFRRALGQMLRQGDVIALSLDLDGFKTINDSQGHAMGDNVLRAVANKATDLWGRDVPVARVSGDEFAIAMPEQESVASDRKIAAFLAWVSHPVHIAGHSLRIAASIGTAKSSVSGRKPSMLLADADLALNKAKSSGKNKWALCTPQLRADYDAAQALGDALLDAMETDQIVPYFQTQHAAGDHRIVGAEALVRWIHPERGMISPGEFLPLAEKLGIMHDLDARVLDVALNDAHQLEAEGLFLPKLNVNVSFARLSDPRLIAHVQRLPATQTKLVFEIVEAVFLDDRVNLEAWNLDLLRERGIGIEIDDFGTGHASIVALMHLRPDRLKIDQKFIRPLPDPDHESLLRSIVGMGASLGIPTTAEGIETAEQADLAADLGIDNLQGFYFGRPCSFEALRGQLRQQAA